MCKDRDAFLSFHKLSHPIDIELGDDTIVTAKYHGLVSIQGFKTTALYTPTFRHSLLSITQFELAGYKTTIQDGVCHIQLPTSTTSTISGRRIGRIYLVSQAGAGTALTATVPPAIPITESKLWHQRMAHLHPVAMQSLLQGYTHDNQQCDVCIQAKHKRKIIRIPVKRTSTPFELIHSDLCGPFNQPSKGGNRYFIVFIDDYTRYPTVYLLKDKRSETCTNAFQHF